MLGKIPAVSVAIVAIAISGMVISGAKAQSGTASQVINAPAPKKAEEQFKNIQVLKGIPADQLIPAMQFITASLGVECDFCHVSGAFEKDEKKTKQTARKMMEMMLTINQENIEGNREVTCYSCHRGNSKPVGMPPVMGEGPKGAEEAAEEMRVGGTDTKAGGQTADQLFDKYLQAVGGAAVDKISSRVMKGTITFGDRNIPIDIYSKDPEKRISFTHTPDGDSVTAFDGHQGWLGIPGHGVREMHGPDIDAAAMDADLHFPLHIKQVFAELRVEYPENIGDREAYVVLGTRNGQPPVKLYFDEQSGLLERVVRYAPSPLGLVPTRIDYGDYRIFDGVEIPFRTTVAQPGESFTFQVEQVRHNVPIDDAKFAKPIASGQKSSGP